MFTLEKPLEEQKDQDRSWVEGGGVCSPDFSAKHPAQHLDLGGEKHPEQRKACGELRNQGVEIDDSASQQVRATKTEKQGLSAIYLKRSVFGPSSITIFLA